MITYTWMISPFNLQQRTEITLSTQQLDKITTELSGDDKKAHVFDALKQPLSPILNKSRTAYRWLRLLGVSDEWSTPMI